MEKWIGLIGNRQSPNHRRVQTPRLRPVSYLFTNNVIKSREKVFCSNPTSLGDAKARLANRPETYPESRSPLRADANQNRYGSRDMALKCGHFDQPPEEQHDTHQPK